MNYRPTLFFMALHVKPVTNMFRKPSVKVQSEKWRTWTSLSPNFATEFSLAVIKIKLN